MVHTVRSHFNLTTVANITGTWSEQFQHKLLSVKIFHHRMRIKIPYLDEANFLSHICPTDKATKQQLT